MLTIQKKRLSAEDRARHEKIIAVEETVASLRKKRMWAAFQLLGLIISGVAISVLTYNLWTGGPAQAAEMLPGTVFTAIVVLLVFTFLSGRGAPRDYQGLLELKRDSQIALDAEAAQTVSVLLDDNALVLRHPEASFLITAGEKSQSAIVDLSASDDLILMFSQPSPPLRHIEWVQDPESGAIIHVRQSGLPPASLDRLDLPGRIGKDAVLKALGIKAQTPITQSKTSQSDLRTKLAALVSE